jgi:hypothetical protein
VLLACVSVLRAQDTTLRTDTVIARYVRPLAIREGARTIFPIESRRYYATPVSMASLGDEASIGFPLLLGDQAYGREALLLTNRPSEPFTSMSFAGILPLNDPLTGAAPLNLYPMEIASTVSLSQRGGAFGASDLAASDDIVYEAEFFSAPLPYSRLHYSQETGEAFSNFEGLFSINPSSPLNVTFAVYRRAAGRAQVPTDLALNPRVDNWWVRTQASYLTDAVNILLWTLYTSAFSGLNGGLVAQDSLADIFNDQLATVRDNATYEHRSRFDALARAEFSLLSETERTTLAGFATLTGRRILSPSSVFPLHYSPLRRAERYGAAFIQPAALTLGAFQTRATVRGDLQHTIKQTGCDCSDVTETRLSAYGSDSIFIGGDFGLGASGFVRGTLSKLDIGGTAAPELFLLQFGALGSLDLTRALRLSAFLNYGRDRASLSPTPMATYELRGLGAFLTSDIDIGVRDRLSVSVGYLDRAEPEGIILPPTDSTEVARPYFSSAEIVSRAFRTNLDYRIGDFRVSANVNYTPAVTSASRYTNSDSLRADPDTKLTGSLGIFFEKEIAEGNLRLSVGARARYMNKISPALTYDPASDYFIYQGLEAHANNTPLNDARLTTPKYLFDLLLASEVDRRAQINLSLLNVTSEPYYNVAIYPRSGFQFRIDVTWALLD